MKSSVKKAYRRLLRALREECAPLLPVAVRVTSLPKDWFGETSLSRDGTCFRILLRSRVVDSDGVRPVTRQELLDALVHEWAHALSWPGVPEAPHLERHGPEWGVAYAKCYQATVED